MDLKEIDERIEVAEKRWENKIPRNEALEAAAEAVLEKIQAMKINTLKHTMASQDQAVKEQVEFLEGVIGILNQVKAENG